MFDQFLETFLFVLLYTLMLVLHSNLRHCIVYTVKSINGMLSCLSFSTYLLIYTNSLITEYTCSVAW